MRTLATGQDDELGGLHTAHISEDREREGVYRFAGCTAFAFDGIAWAVSCAVLATITPTWTVGGAGWRGLRLNFRTALTLAPSTVSICTELGILAHGRLPICTYPLAAYARHQQGTD
jgi:hypothetical protein